MKKYFLLALLAGSLTTGAQSIKDALYGGRLKNDTGSVVRKGDDLSTKIDTATKKPAEPEKPKVTAVTRDSSGALVPVSKDPASVSGDSNVATNNANATIAIKDNNKIWKEYMDSLASTLKEEALPSKKIKAGTYYILIQYEIDVDGQVGVTDVSCSPENSFLAQTVKERITLTSPKLNPVLSNYGKARKSAKKYTLTLTKE